jgi:DNA-binding transcriptional regulator YiaG
MKKANEVVSIRARLFYFANMCPLGTQRKELAEMTAKQIRLIRRLHEMTRAQFADRVGLSVSLIKKLERGERNITERSRRMIMQAFGLTAAQLEKLNEIKEMIENGG